MAHPIECDPKENPFNVQYVRTGAVPSGDSVLMYDLGLTHLAVSGCQTSGKRLGDLWVTYEVELKKPLLYSNVTSRIESCSALFTSGMTATYWFGTSAKTMVGSLPVVALNNTLTFPKGTVGSFQIWIEVGGNTLALTLGTYDVTGCVLTPPIAEDPSTTYYRNLSGASLVDTVWGIKITDPGVSPVVTFGFGGSATTITSVRVSITQIA